MAVTQPGFIAKALTTNVDATLVYQLASVDYEWPSDATRTNAVTNGDFVVENNLVAGLKVYGETVYVTVPRWKDGVPASLNSLVQGSGGETLLRPFPSWDMNKIGDCSALQFVQSMEIDPNTGYMWIIDTGRIDTMSVFSTSQNLCPAKIVILDILSKTTVRSHEFPNNVVSSTSNFLNDVALDYVEGRARYVYISDASDGKIVVYDYENDDSYYYEDDSMKRNSKSIAPIDGIAMSHDFQYVYYSTLKSAELYAIPTSVLRAKKSDFYGNRILVGNRADGSDGMAYGRRSLFYGGLDTDAVYKVTAEGQGHVVSMETEELVISDGESVQWPDTFAWNGTDLWFVANKIGLFQNGMDFSGNTINMYIWKLDVGEHGYLWNAAKRTGTPETQPVG